VEIGESGHLTVGASELDAFVKRAVAPIFLDADFTRKGRSFRRERPPLVVGATFLYRRRFNSEMRGFDVRFDVSMPAVSDRVAILSADLSHLSGRRQPAWQWPLLEPEADVTASLQQALIDLGLPWCETHSSLDGVRKTLEAGRPCLNRSRYLSYVHEQMDHAAEALFWWEEFCRTERPETGAGSPARQRLEGLRKAVSER
jgi:hypothetical protein